MNSVCAVHKGQETVNSTPRELTQEVIRRKEGQIVEGGAISVRTGLRTGRSPHDKFIVDAPGAEGVAWGETNQRISESHFDFLLGSVGAYLQERNVYVQDCYAGADTEHRISLRVITELAWHSLFAQNMFIPRSDRPVAEFTVVAVPGFQANPCVHGTNSEAFIVIHFGKKLALIGGTHYAGEIKKTVFTFLNYVLPPRGVLPMHCSANIDSTGKTAIFFGLSGTGKTTLSADQSCKLIGDDEHGWSSSGIFNFEGGCYAKVIRLSATAEPEIYAATKRDGTVLENVVLGPSGDVDFDDDSITENTRAAYPIKYIPNAEATGRGSHPTHIFMLTADAFGVLPPISRLRPEQAMYHFLSGYTAKIAGTEAGLGKEPQATFSTCFGAPFMPRHPAVYGQLLRTMMKKFNVECWLVNTGWTGGPFGIGKRITIAHTRAMINAARSGALSRAPMRLHPVFNMYVPVSCPSVPADLLDARATWKDLNAYDAKAKELAAQFKANFEEYASHTEPSVVESGPR